MGKRKYIIELPDDEHLISWWTYTGTEDGKQHIDFHEVVKTPYDLDAIRKEAYQRGLVDAWETVRKIADLPTVEERENIFACAFTNDVIRLYTATEAIEKIRQYEKEQEEIRVGDEVIGIYSSGEQTKPFVITKWISDYYFGIYSDSGEFCQGGLKLQKTGRYFPEIAEVLKKMQEETA